MFQTAAGILEKLFYLNERKKKSLKFANRLANKIESLAQTC